MKTCQLVWSVLGLLCFAAIPVLAEDPKEPVAEAVATPTAKTPAVASVPAAPKSGEPEAKPKGTPLAATLSLIGGAELSGTLLDVTEIPMKTSFGDATIPLSQVAGIRLAQEGQNTTTIVLHNGDAITGAVDLPNVRLETEWGKAEVYGHNVTTLMFAKGLRWSSESSVSGTRWKLVEESKGLPPGTVPGTTPVGTTGSRPVTSTTTSPTVRPPTTTTYFPFQR